MKSDNHSTRFQRVYKALALWMLAFGALIHVAADVRGQGADPSLSVMILPVDGGTQEGTLADYLPTLDAVSRTTGINFRTGVGQNYSAVIEALATGLIDVAQFGLVSYGLAQNRGGARFLAMQVQSGSSVYHAAIFVAADGPIKSLADLRGKSIALGDPTSSSAFVFPLLMMMDAGIDPRRDLAGIALAGSQANALRTLSEGRVDAAAGSLISYARAVERGLINPSQIRPLARSMPIPNPLFAVRSDLPEDVFQQLRHGFATVHTDDRIRPEMLRGYGGNLVERWDTEVPEDVLIEAINATRRITPEFTAEILAIASRTRSRR